MVAFRLENASFRLLFVSAVVLWWSRNGSVVVARWLRDGRAVVARWWLRFVSRTPLFVFCLCVRWFCGGRAVVLWWSRGGSGGRAVVAFLSRELLCSSSVRVCGDSVVVAQWFCGGAVVLGREVVFTFLGRGFFICAAAELQT